jgi:hypothetical protein
VVPAAATCTQHTTTVPDRVEIAAIQNDGASVAGAPGRTRTSAAVEQSNPCWLETQIVYLVSEIPGSFLELLTKKLTINGTTSRSRSLATVPERQEIYRASSYLLTVPSGAVTCKYVASLVSV